MIKELLAYQVEDANLRKIETELMGSEDRKKAVSAKKFLDTVPESVEKLDDLSKKLYADFENLSAEEKKIKEQQEEFAHAIESVSDKTEANYLLKKIDELLNKLKTITTSLNKVNDEMQAVVKEYVGVRNKIKLAQEQYAEFGKKYNDLKASFNKEKTEIEEKLAVLSKKVDPALMEAYAKKRANKMFPIVYKARGNVCGRCNMELSISEMNKLKNGEILEHDQCGALLYQED